MQLKQNPYKAEKENKVSYGYPTKNDKILVIRYESVG